MAPYAAYVALAAAITLLLRSAAIHGQSCQSAVPVVDRLEFTQGTQFKDKSQGGLPPMKYLPAHEDNSVPMVASRFTTVRMYVKSDPPGCPLYNVDALLHVMDGLWWTPYLHAENGPLAYVPPEGSDRLDEDGTLNFTYGSVAATVHPVTAVVGYRSLGDFNITDTTYTPAQYISCTAPRILAVPFDYQYSGAP